MYAMASAPPSWTGFYAGLDLGWLGNRGSVAELASGYTDYTADMTVNGVIGGGHVGYNWQMQQFVFGVETDISGAGGSQTVSFGGGAPPDTFSSRVNWLSTFRGRVGFAFEDWLLYGTVGWAVAGVHNTRNSNVDGFFVVDESKTKSGFVWGGGVERMFAPNWTARVEAMAVDLGSSTITTILPPLTYITRFSNKEVVVRGGVSYKW